MKKGFTFAELMISLVIISVISAILYPTIADLAPNENAALFRSAYRSMSIALSEVMNDTSDGAVPTDLCPKLAAKLNVRNNACPPLGTPGAGTFTTSNGMRWYVSDTSACALTPNHDSCFPIIIIDVAASNNDSGANDNLPTNGQIPTLGANYTITTATQAFTAAFNNGAIGGQVDDGKKQDTFVFGFSETGTMVGMDQAGYSHIDGKQYPPACDAGYHFCSDTKQCVKNTP